MAAKTLTEIKTWAVGVLQDTGETRWDDTEISLHLDGALRTLAEYFPNVTRNICRIVYKTGSATSTSTDKLVDATNAQFVAADDERTVYNVSDKTVTEINAVDSDSIVAVDDNIFAEDESYEIYCIGGSDPRDVYVGGITDLVDVLRVEYPIGQEPRKRRNFERMGNSLTIRLLLDDNPTTSDHDLPVFVFANIPHTLTDSASTLTPQTERLVVELTAANAAISKGMLSLDQVREAIAAYTLLEADVADMTARLTLAASDLGDGRTEADKVPAIITLAQTDISKIDAQITRAIADANEGRPKVNNIPKGGRIANTYIPLATSALEGARAYINKARVNLQQATADASIANTYTGLAYGELATARTHLEQAGGYLRVLTSRLGLANTVRLYQNWGEAKLAIVMADLRRLRKRESKHTYARD